MQRIFVLCVLTSTALSAAIAACGGFSGDDTVIDASTDAPSGTADSDSDPADTSSDASVDAQSPPTLLRTEQGIGAIARMSATGILYSKVIPDSGIYLPELHYAASFETDPVVMLQTVGIDGGDAGIGQPIFGSLPNVALVADGQELILYASPDPKGTGLNGVVHKNGKIVSPVQLVTPYGSYPYVVAGRDKVYVVPQGAEVAGVTTCLLDFGSPKFQCANETFIRIVRSNGDTIERQAISDIVVSTDEVQKARRLYFRLKDSTAASAIWVATYTEQSDAGSPDAANDSDATTDSGFDGSIPPPTALPNVAFANAHRLDFPTSTYNDPNTGERPLWISADGKTLYFARDDFKTNTTSIYSLVVDP